MKNLKCKVVGNNEIRINNPQCADPLNKYTKKIKPLGKIHHSKKTDADRELQANISFESKLYFNDELGLYVPTNWFMSALGGVSHKLCKIGKKVLREGVFINGTKSKLNYHGIKTVKKIEDIVLNPIFRERQFHNINNSTVPIDMPTFSNWSFTIDLDFDEEVVTEEEMLSMLRMAVVRKGFGDFRPTYGRGQIEDLVISECEF